MAATWLEGLIYGIRSILAGASPLPDRPAVSFSGSGVTVTDDVANNRTSVVITGGGAAPSGTGIPHVVAGAYAGAATKIVDADVDPAAAIAATKLAAGTNGQWLTTAAGAAGWATPSWTDASINAAAAIALSKLATTGALSATSVAASAGVTGATGTFSGALVGVPLRGGGGTFPTSAGRLQFGNVAQVLIGFREISNSTDINVIEVASGSNLIFGNTNWSNLAFNTWSTGVIAFNAAAVEKVRFDAGTNDTAEFSLALAGALSGAANKPLRLKPAIYPMPSDANQTPGQSVYACSAIEVVGGATLTSNRSIILPTVAGAIYVFRNATTGGFALVPKTSAGAGPTVNNGTTVIIYCNGTDYIKITV